MEKILVPSLIAATLIMLATALAHVFLGGPEINAAIQASTLPDEVRATSAVVWHMITALLIMATLGMALLIRRPDPMLAAVLFMFCALFAALFVGISMIEFGTVLRLPQWTAFAVCAALLVPSLHMKKASR